MLRPTIVLAALIVAAATSGAPMAQAAPVRPLLREPAAAVTTVQYDRHGDRSRSYRHRHHRRYRHGYAR